MYGVILFSLNASYKFNISSGTVSPDLKVDETTPDFPGILSALVNVISSNGLSFISLIQRLQISLNSSTVCPAKR